MKKLTINLPDRLDAETAAKYSADYLLTTLTAAPGPINPFTTHLATSQGKGMRSKLLMACSIGDDGLVPQDIIYAAASVEIFHLATLVHDDIIDDADTRRGIQSVHARFGKKEAVICGDFLLCAALRIASFIEPPGLIEKFAQAVERVCLGEIRQLSNNYNSNLTLLEYLRTIRGKTAALFYICAYAGAMISQSEQINQLSKFGTYFGMMFQMIDDCKDYTETESLKPTKKDLLTGVINLPLLMAFIKEPGLRHIAKEVMADPKNSNTLLDEVRRLCGVDDSHKLIARYENKARAIIKTLKNRKKAEALEALLNQLTVNLKEQHI